MPDAGAVVVVLLVAAIFGVVVIAARRFERRRRREGAWTEKGPIDPSLPPPDFLQVFPRPWGIGRPSIESIDEENPFTDPIHDDSDRESHR